MSINRGMDKEDGRLPWWFPDRVYLPIQETQVTWSGKIRHALEQLSPCTTTELVLWSPGATVSNDWAHMPQWLSSHAAVTELTCRSDRAHMPQWPSSHAAVTELTCRSDWAHMPQWLRPVHQEPMLRNKKSHHSEKPMYHNQKPLSLQLEKALTHSNTEQHSQN